MTAPPLPAAGAILRVVDVPAAELAGKIGELATARPGLRLVDLTALDSADDGPVAVYQLRDDDGRVEVKATQADELPSLVGRWVAADWLEREVAEGGGIRFPERTDTPPLMKVAPEAETGGDEAEPVDGEAELADPALASAPRLDLRVRVRGGTITGASAHPGRVHSGFEGLAERRTYTQLPVLAESLNEQAPYAVGLAAVLAAEALLGVTPPPRCTWVRTLLAEVSRVAAHCAWLANRSADDDALWGQALTAREAAARFLAAASGRRWATGAQRIGGIAADVPDQAAPLLADLRARVDALRSAAEDRTVGHRGWSRRFAGVAVLDAADVRSAGASGPVARAAGCAHDIRRAEPYLAYGELAPRVPTGSAGDVVDRVRVRLEEMADSVALAGSCLAAMPSGPTLTDEAPAPSRQLTGAAELIHHFERWMDGHGYRPPAGARAYVPTESADGELAFLLVSDGTSKPARAHLRSPSLFHFQVLPALLPGVRRSLAAEVVTSLNVVAAEMDR